MSERLFFEDGPDTTVSVVSYQLDTVMVHGKVNALGHELKSKGNSWPRAGMLGS